MRRERSEGGPIRPTEEKQWGGNDLIGPASLSSLHPVPHRFGRSLGSRSRLSALRNSLSRGLVREGARAQTNPVSSEASGRFAQRMRLERERSEPNPSNPLSFPSVDGLGLDRFALSPHAHLRFTFCNHKRAGGGGSLSEVMTVPWEERRETHPIPSFLSYASSEGNEVSEGRVGWDGPGSLCSPFPSPGLTSGSTGFYG